MWQAELHHLETIGIPRCYKAKMVREPEEYQLHVFCDASQTAFGAVAYARMTTSSCNGEEGTVASSFVMAKTRLAPLKQLSIVRLELQAAVLACRLAACVKQSMTYSFSQFFIGRTVKSSWHTFSMKAVVFIRSRPIVSPRYWI